MFACLVAVMMTACNGGGSSKKTGNAEQAAQEIVNETVKKAGIEATATGNWPANEFTKQVSKPDIAIKAAGIVKTKNSEMFSLTFADGTTKEQINSYVEKVKSEGFTKNISESDDSTSYTFSARNEAEYSVVVMWMPSTAGLMISKK
jgi:hypothetical protein